MRNEFSKLAFTVGISLALTFNISCGDHIFDEMDSSSNSSSSSNNNSNVSSSSVQSSSSNISSNSSAQVVGVHCDMNYRTVQIGDQIWMAENLNCDVGDSRCYGNNPANCAIYGRLYKWATAMNIPASCNTNYCSQIGTVHQGICPSGWHIPSSEDWDKLYRYVDGINGTSSYYESTTAGRYLKATSGWNSNGNGQDIYGFSALPGGGDFGGLPSDVGKDGYWWTTLQSGKDYAQYRGMTYRHDGAYYSGNGKTAFFSVRCLQD